MNLSFLAGDFDSDAVRYESFKHVDAALDEHGQEQLHGDCQYSQHTAAKYLREQVDCIRDAVPDPDTTPFEQRQYGGFVHITGRHGSTFNEILDSLTPDPDRFDESASTPSLVPEGSEAERAKQEFLIDAEIVI